MGQDCSVLGWSSALSAPLSANLAAVLAGFVFTSIVFLISSDGRKHARALGLFCSAFVVLGFDSHLFSVLSGTLTDKICARVWTEGVTASGLLGVGAMAIITGIIWLLPIDVGEAVKGSAEAPGESDASDAIRLNGIVLTMAYGVSLAVTVLLASTIYNYLYVIRSGHVPTPWVVWMLISPGIVAVIAGVIALWRRRRGDRSERDRISAGALQLSAYGILGYALAGTVFSGLIANLDDSSWQPTSNALVVLSIFMGLIIPGMIFIALIHSMPRLPTRAKDRATAPKRGVGILIAGPDAEDL